MEPDLAPMIEDDRRCPICLDLFHRPTSLQPCQHALCDPCCRRLAGARINQCPVCRSPIEDCHLDQELHDSIEDQHQDLYIQRQEDEMNSGIFNLPLPPVLPPVRRTFEDLFNEFQEFQRYEQLLVILSLQIQIVPMALIIYLIAFFVWFLVQELWR